MHPRLALRALVIKLVSIFVFYRQYLGFIKNFAYVGFITESTLFFNQIVP
jgi:hypothetical protein